MEDAEPTEIDTQDETEIPSNDADDIRSIIESEFKKVATDSALDSQSESKATAARTRDDKGRFAKGASSQPEPAPTSTTKISDQAISETVIEPGNPSSVIEAPHSWSAEKRELFKSLPREAQEYIAQRDREVNQALSRRKSQETEHAGRYEQTIQQYRDVFEQVDPRSGARVPIDPVVGIQALLSAQRKLASNFPAAVQEMARANGYQVELKPLNPEHGAPVDSYNPVIHQVIGEIQNLKQHLATKEQRQQQEYLTSHIEAFRKETDGNGQLKRPFFEDVRQQMGRIVEYLESTEPGLSEREYLERAYDEAVWANPTTREKLRAHELEQSRKDQERKRQVERAERASGSVRGSPGGGSLNVSVGDSVEEIIRAAMNGTI